MHIAEKKFSSKVNSKCGHCGSNRLEIVCSLKYFELFIIPFFPVSRTYRKICRQCHNSTAEPAPAISPISRFQYISKFTGLLLIPLFVILYFIHAHKQVKAELDILTTPLAFDFYLVDLNKLNLTNTHEFPYSIAKVTQVNEGKLNFKLANYSYQNERSIIKDIRSDTLLINHYFSTKLYTIQKNDLLQYKANGTILKALRPENLTLFGGLVITPKELNRRGK